MLQASASKDQTVRLWHMYPILECRRQWLRLLWRPEHWGVPVQVAAARGAIQQLLDFFTFYPGLRRLVGCLVCLYYTPYKV